MGAGPLVAGCRIVSSPLARAADTATAVATACGLEPSLDARLRERLNWGDVPGQPFDEFVELWERCTADRHHVPAVSGGRSACKAGCAAVELIDDVVITCGGGPIVVVAHGGLLVDLLLCLRDTDRAGPIDPAVDVAYCSITHLRWDKDRVEVRSLASTTHLDQVRTTRVD